MALNWGGVVALSTGNCSTWWVPGWEVVRGLAGWEQWEVFTLIGAEIGVWCAVMARAG